MKSVNMRAHQVVNVSELSVFPSDKLSILTHRDEKKHRQESLYFFSFFKKTKPKQSYNIIIPAKDIKISNLHFLRVEDHSVLGGLDA